MTNVDSCDIGRRAQVENTEFSYTKRKAMRKKDTRYKLRRKKKQIKIKLSHKVENRSHVC
jgi:hypothetical protein